jgi:alanine racemase
LRSLRLCGELIQKYFYGGGLLQCPIVWAEVDFKAITHNVRELRRITSPDARLMAVVKANAYGHGLVEVAGKALESGAQALGVARASEGIQLRKAVYSYKTAKALSAAANSFDKTIRVHLKVDTGMGRLGVLPDCFRTLQSSRDVDNAVHEVEAIARLRNLEIEGIYTHFAIADSPDSSYTENQLEIFMNFIDQLKRAGLEFPVKHAANSAAVINMPKTHLDMVRVGISIYGLYTSDHVDKSRIDLKPAMELKARIIHLKKVPAGFKVSYGITYETEKATTIATVPIGYADGFNRLLSSHGHMLVCGRKAPIIGRVCMDMTMLDVGDIPEVSLEDEVVIFGKQGDASITVDEIASSINTINYEIISTIADRVPRIYLQ